MLGDTELKILVTGAKGQLGTDMVKRLEEMGLEYQGVDQEDFDLTNREAVFNYLKDCRPEAVIHCAAYTAVDKAEDDQELCYSVNVKGTSYLAQVCREINAKLLYLSTDYIFDGSGETPFETDSKPNPINHYGLTKYQGELEIQKYLDAFFIVRISWVFGKYGPNFVKTMINLAQKQDEIKVVADQIGSPTYTYDLSLLLAEMIQTEQYGVYHATNEGYCSWYQLAKESIEIAGYHCKVVPIASSDYPTRAVRPKNSRLSKNSLDKAGFNRLPHYSEALRGFIQELNKC